MFLPKKAFLPVVALCILIASHMPYAEAQKQAKMAATETTGVASSVQTELPCNSGKIAASEMDLWLPGTDSRSVRPGTPASETGGTETYSEDSSNDDASFPSSRCPIKDWLQEWNPFCFKIYWDDGIRLGSPEEKIKIKIGGRLQVDGGYVWADDSLQDAFTDLPTGGQALIRRARVSLLAKFHDRVEFKLEADFSGVPTLNDDYIDIERIPFIGHFRFGHTKEPFSLEELTSSNNITFMERSLPTSAFAPGRNIGFELYNSVFNQRLTWATGGFWDVGGINHLTNPKDAFSNATGFSLTARVTAIPWYADGGRNLVHLGLGYSHSFRTDPQVSFLTRPESYLFDDKLVDTGKFIANDIDIIDCELALVRGPFSLQGEFFQTFATSSEDHYFWGYYIYLSYILTGEVRPYNTFQGVFSALKPQNDFKPFGGQSGLGAWELALRHSYIDLNDGSVEGGKESNFTAGLNWYVNSHIRFMINYIHARVENRTMPESTSGSANIVQSRFQVFF